MAEEAKRHHYAPEFYLSQWVNKEDGRLYIVRNFNGEIRKTRRPPSETGFEYHLYSYTEEYSSSDRAEIETKFLSPLDSEGAKIIRKFLCGEELEKRERIVWAQFLCAMRVRTPENVAKVKKHATEYMTREFELDQSKYEALKGPDDPERYVDWVALERPSLLENIGVSQIPKIASSHQALSDILRMSWYAVEFQFTFPLLTSDRPYIVTAGLQDPDCIIALPLSPNCAFFAFYPESKAQSVLMNTPVKHLAAAINRNVVGQAKERAYSQNCSDAPDSFYKTYLTSSI